MNDDAVMFWHHLPAYYASEEVVRLGKVIRIGSHARK